MKGHTLVIPKQHCAIITETPPEILAGLIAVVRRVACSQVTGLGADGVSVSQANGDCAGQLVPHLHFHVIPRFEQDGRPAQWEQKQYDSSDEMDYFVDRMGAAMAVEE